MDDLASIRSGAVANSGGSIGKGACVGVATRLTAASVVGDHCHLACSSSGGDQDVESNIEVVSGRRIRVQEGLVQARGGLADSALHNTGVVLHDLDLLGLTRSDEAHGLGDIRVVVLARGTEGAGEHLGVWRGR